MIKVYRYNAVSYNPKILAYVDIQYHGLIIKGFKVVDGARGLFLSFPREKNKNNDWFDRIIPVDAATKDEIEKIALDYHHAQTKGALDEVDDMLSNQEGVV